MAARMRQTRPLVSILVPIFSRRSQWGCRTTYNAFAFTRIGRRNLGSLVRCSRVQEGHGPRTFASALVEEWRTDEDEGEGARSESSASNKSYILPPAVFALSLFGRKEKEAKKVDELEKLLKQARLAEHHRDWKKADDFYHQALALLNARKQAKIWDDDRILEAQVYIYDNMANLSLASGKMKEAENLYKETIKGLLQANKAKDCNAIVEISLKLAMIYAMQQRKAEAEEGYKFCIKTQQDKLLGKVDVDDDSLALLGMCVNSYSRFLILHKRLKDAQVALKKTIEVAVQVFGNDHPQVAVLYSDLSTVDTFQENYDAAKEHINKAIEVGTRANSPDVCTFLCNLGLICLERNECTEAEDSCRRALKMAKEQKNVETEVEAKQCLNDIKGKQQEKKK